MPRSREWRASNAPSSRGRSRATSTSSTPRAPTCRRSWRWTSVDKTRTTHQLHPGDLRGARGRSGAQLIIDEASRTLDEQGLTVDIRHIMLVADLMTNDGDVKAIGRHGISGTQIERPGQGGVRDHRGPPAARGADRRGGPPGRRCRKHYSRAAGYARDRGRQPGICT